MSNVVTLANVRADRFKQALARICQNGQSVVIRTRTRAITAERINCRDRIVEVLDGVGEYFVVTYDDILSLQPAPVAQTSIVNARGEFSPPQNAVHAPRGVAIIPFARQPLRK
jgi:hypothetical protein